MMAVTGKRARVRRIKNRRNGAIVHLTDTGCEIAAEQKAGVTDHRKY